MGKKFKASDAHLYKLLVHILKHGAPRAHLKTDEAGFVDVGKMLRISSFAPYCLDAVIRVAENDPVNEFKLRRGAAGQWYIRANHGHSFPVSPEHILTPLTLENLPPLLFYGTSSCRKSSIHDYGIRRFENNHIIFCDKFPANDEAVSGMRKSCDMIIIADAHKASQQGLKFYRSESGAIATPGDSKNTFPASCLVSYHYVSRGNCKPPRLLEKK